MLYNGKEINAVRYSANTMIVNFNPNANVWTIVSKEEDKIRIAKELKIENDGDKRRE